MTPDERFMDRALRLAARGGGKVSPNPMVGAVLVRDGLVIAEGWHRACGQDHAEVEALRQAGDAAVGADLYVNLEPCCHFGRTPPCTGSLVTAGVRRVFVGMIDPNPLVSGRGIAALREAGIEVIVGTREDACRRLNAPFLSWITRGRPLVTLKLASTLDGRIADRSGGSRWISSPVSRRWVHRLRALSDAVMVGAGTATTDDPLLLATRVRASRQPLRIVVDTTAGLPIGSSLVSSTDRGPVVVAAGNEADPDRVRALQSRGVEVLKLPVQGDHVDMKALLEALGRRPVTSVLVEGGPVLAASLMKAGLVDRLILFMAPVVLGDPMARSLTGDMGIRELSASLGFRIVEAARSGPDLRIELEPVI
jgi:diaminohydroxyphosphoribosylaminopyrimidine deaminase/5-amino-6-(5-phosphoribosylamino)uracil reductase